MFFCGVFCVFWVLFYMCFVYLLKECCYCVGRFVSLMFLCVMCSSEFCLY